METKEVVQKRFSRNLKRLRSIDDLTQRETAEAIGVKLSTYGAWEYGFAIPTPTVLIRVSALFKVSINDLLESDI